MWEDGYEPPVREEREERFIEIVENRKPSERFMRIVFTLLFAISGYRHRG